MSLSGKLAQAIFGVGLGSTTFTADKSICKIEVVIGVAGLVLMACVSLRDKRRAKREGTIYTPPRPLK
jgi:hypothetical protein